MSCDSVWLAVVTDRNGVRKFVADKDGAICHCTCPHAECLDGLTDLISKEPDVSKIELIEYTPALPFVVN